MGYLDHIVSDFAFREDPTNICRIWNGLSLLGIAILYFPKSQTRIQGEAAKAIFKEIDYAGGFFSIVGLTLLYGIAPSNLMTIAD